ncbi:uncharacterized protein LOC135694228 [Rhopilema esculentum]|uniref:uncharacterized protein LOC135694228 n=1 Tax=Rhopilema esculentum TaxID=499914 RepID=UPI0031E2CDF0
MPTIKYLADLNKKGLTPIKVLKKSKGEHFPEKLVSDPGCKAKLIKIELLDDEYDGIGQKSLKAGTEDSGDPENSDVTPDSGEELLEDSEDEETEISGDEGGAEHTQTEKVVAGATIMIEEEKEEEKGKGYGKTVPPPQRSHKGSVKKRGRKENEHNEKNEEKKTGKQEAKAPSSDIAKERDALKRRVLQLERKVERLEYETRSLADEKEMLKRAYKSEKREREYLEEILDKLDEEKDAKEAERKSKERKQQKQEKEAEKPWSQMSQYDMQLQTEKETIRELEKKAELAKLREYQEHLKAKIITQPQDQQIRMTQYQQQTNNQPNQFYQYQPIQTLLPESQNTPNKVQNFGKRECRYEKKQKGSCRWGNDCKFSHNIGGFGGNADEKDRWRASGLCFAHMTGVCIRTDCRFLHPEKQRYKETGYLQQTDVTNLIEQCIKDSMDSIKKEIVRDIQYHQQQQVPQHPWVSWDPTLV